MSRSPTVCLSGNVYQRDAIAQMWFSTIIKVCIGYTTERIAEANGITAGDRA
jgi:hypothetical protein